METASSRPGNLSLPLIRVLRTTVLAFVACVAGSTIAIAEEPLHARIDQYLAELHPGPESPLCTDGEFLRRVYLDLIGRIPSAEQARQFLADPSPAKRVQVVDELLASPAHAQHMAQVFDLILMERRADKYVKKEEWNSYLLTSFQQNKPINQLAHEILSADGVDEKLRGPAKFYLDREAEPNLITREVGRMFFGMDLQCAQCHDHPSIDDYYQADYYGLFAFVSRSYLFHPDKKKPAVLAEKAEGDAKFKSVFTEEEGSTLPRLPGSVEIDEPSFGKDDAYQVKPDPKKKEVRPIPKHSRRQELANRATDGSNRVFNRNLANRLWAHMMGRGLVHPVDQHHSGNPPVQPQLLEILADELPKAKFDAKAILRELALSRTYQRRVDLPGDFAPHATSAGQQIETWNQRLADLHKRVDDSGQAADELESQLEDKRASLPALVDAKKKADETLAASAKTAAEAKAALVDGQQTLAKYKSVTQLLADSADKASAAATELPADPQLVEAIKLLQNRRQDFEAKIAAQTTAVTALSAADTAAKTKLAADQQVAAEASDALETTNSGVATDAQKLAQATQDLRLARTEVSHAREQIKRLQFVVSYGDALRQQAAREDEINKLTGQIAAAQGTISKLTGVVDRLAKDLPLAESAHAQCVAAKSAAEQQRDATRKAASLLATSLDKANQAAQLFSADAELKTAIATLASSSQSLSSRAAAADQQVAKTTAAEQESAAKVQSLRELMTKSKTELTSATEQMANWQTQQADKSRQLAELADKLQTQRAAVANAWSQQFSIAVVQPLSPEQLAWSMLQTTGYADRQQASVAAAVNKKTPLKPAEQNDPAKLAAREQEIKTQTDAKLKAHVNRFVKLFAAAGGQPQDDFFATVDQALFFRNGGELQSWLAPSGGNLTDRLRQIEDATALAEELYLSVLTRLPTAEETADVASFLAAPETDKSKAVQEMAWALLTSAEFRFQH
jgi:hypothetical protein